MPMSDSDPSLRIRVATVGVRSNFMLTEITEWGTDMAARSCLLMMGGAIAPFCLFVGLVFWATPCFSATAGAPAANELVIAKDEVSDAVIVRSPRAGNYERLAAADLAKYIEM